MADSAPRAITIEGRLVRDDSACYVIAEIGHNHQGNLETCKKMFTAAKDCGADAVKLQKRDNRALYTKQMFERPYDSENAFGPTYGLHREALELGRDAYIELKQHARQLGITFFATAFDVPSADFLEALDMPAYKIASGDLRNLELIKHVASFGKPMIVSTGGGTLEDVKRMVGTVTPINSRLAVLQCTAAYPCPYELLDLNVIVTYRELFRDTVIGFSAHDNGIAMTVAAYTLGARIVEKHFTLDRAMKGTDHAFSLEPVGLRKLVRDLRRVRVALGDGHKKVHPPEKDPITKMGKKIVTTRSLPAGHVLRREDLGLKSPGDGLSPALFESLLGRQLLSSVPEEHPLRIEDVKAHD